MKTTFTYRDLLLNGWEKTKEHFLFILVSFLILIALSALVSLVPILGSIANMLLAIAGLSLCLAVVHDKVPSIETIRKSLSSIEIVWHYVVATILYSLIVGFGLLFLILPGIYLAVRLQFYAYDSVEHEHHNPLDSLKRSWALTRGHFWKLFGFFLVVLCIVLLSAIPFGLGLIFSIPVVSIAHAYFYKHLASHHQLVATEPETV